MTWHDRLTTLEQSPDESALHLAVRDAVDWPTSPAGEYRPILEARGVTFDDSGCPSHRWVCYLVFRFAGHVAARRFADAREVLQVLARYRDGSRGPTE